MYSPDEDLSRSINNIPDFDSLLQEAGRLNSDALQQEMQNMNSMKPMDDTPMVVVEGISVAFMAIIIVAAALYIINLGVCIAACVKAGMMNNQSSKTLWICLLVFLGILPFGGGIGNLVIFVFACILISSFNGKKNRPNLQMTWNF